MSEFETTKGAKRREHWGSAIASLDSGYFAVVMATGIVSVAAHRSGAHTLALVLLWLTGVAFVVLVATYLVRAIRFREAFVASLTDPRQAVAYFTVVAGFNVLASALLPHGLWPISLVLGAIALVAWVALTYGFFTLVVLVGRRPRLRDINGGWLIWVVGTQSVSVLGSDIARLVPWAWVGDGFGIAALVSWSVGVVLYLVLVVIIFARLFLLPTSARELGPAYWILMGATAISVLAAVGLLSRGAGLPVHVLDEMRGFIAGLSIVLWSFGTWFIPMLIVFGVWRHIVRRYSWRYEPGLWSIVFPLGMYAVASAALGEAIGFTFVRDIAIAWAWIAVAAWVAVTALGVAAFARFVRVDRAPTAPHVDAR